MIGGIMSKVKTRLGNNKQLLVIMVLWIIIAAFFSATTSGFATSNNIFNLLRQVSVMGLLSIGMAIVVVSGGLDLSVGSQVALTSVIIGKLNVDLGVNIFLCLLIAISVGIIVGFFNGWVINTFEVAPMIATLSMQTILSGISFNITNAMAIYGIDERIKTFGQGYIGTVPIPVIITVIFMAIGVFLLKKTYIGRYFYAVGSNAEATRLSGISVKSVRIVSYVICGIMSSLGGIVMTGRLNSGQPTCGDGLEMDVLTAIIVGGVSTIGGKGSMLGVALGVLLIGTLANGLGVMGVSSYNQKIAKGLVLLAVICVDGVSTIIARSRVVQKKSEAVADK